jgi:hypothetical protein
MTGEAVVFLKSILAACMEFQRHQVRPDRDVAHVVVGIEDRLQKNYSDFSYPVCRALDEGKITPDQFPWALEFCRRDPEAFRNYVSRQPKKGDQL